MRASCDAAEVLAVRRTRELNASDASEPVEQMLANQADRSDKTARTASHVVHVGGWGWRRNPMEPPRAHFTNTTQFTARR